MRTLILFLCSFPAFGAINATVQWDVRTTGSDSNGGAFDPGVSSPGTDYSQQNAAQIAYTDLIIGATTTQYTSVLNPVNAAIVGNLIQITGGSGCTTGFYEVLSHATITATVDRSMGTAASVCTANLGGSLATIAAAFAAVTVPYNAINLKAGTYTQTSTLTASSVNFIQMVGYQSTHGDGGTKPLITTATNSIDLIDVPYSAWVFNNISFSTTAGSPGLGVVKTGGNGPGYFRNCKFSGFSNAINGDNSGYRYIWVPLVVENTEIANGSTGISNQNNVYIGPGTYIHGQTTDGIVSFSGQVDGAIFDSNGYGVSLSGSGGATVALITNSVFSNSTHDGINGNGVGLGVVNSVFYGNGGYGINFTSGTFPVSFFANNAFGSNVTGPYTGLTLTASDTASIVSLGACNPFTSSTVFTLSTCGKAALAGAGFPGVTPAGTGYLDIGALQSQGSSGSTGGGPHAFVQ